MNAALKLLRRHRLWPAWIFLGGLLLLLPGLGGPGFWEPHEIKVADEARTRLERYSLADISRSTATHYKVKEADLKKAKRTDRQTEARNMAIYLADVHTKETYSDLRRSFGLEKHEVVDSVIQGMRERLGNSAEPDLAQDRTAVELLLSKSASAKKPKRPPLTEWAISRGLSSVSWDEWGARLPLALMGLLALMATFFLGQRLGGPRTGLLAALVMMSFPLFILQSRQLTSDIGAVMGQAVMMLGLVGLSWPAGNRQTIPIGLQAARYAGDAALVVFGSIVTYYSAGALLGILPPLAAIALANPIAAVADRRRNEPSVQEHPDAIADSDRTWRLLHLLTVGVVVGIIAVGVLGWLVTEIFEFTDPIPDQRQIFGMSWKPEGGYIEALGGGWKLNGDLRQTFDSLFEQLAFGLFPWSALAPIALAYVAAGARRGRRSWAGYTLFLWAIIAWAFGTIMSRKVGPVHYPALAAVAVAVGMWLDDLLSARQHAASIESDGSNPSESDEAAEFHNDSAPDAHTADVADAAARKRFGIGTRLPLAGFFVATAAMTLAKDLSSFPEQLTSIHLLGQTVTYPKDLWLSKGVLAIGVLFALSGLVALWLWKKPGTGRGIISAVQVQCGRFGIPVLLASGLMLSLFLAQVWTPTLSRKLSSKHLFAVYHQLKSPGDRLGVMGNHGNGPKYYAGDSFTRLRNRNGLLEFLKDERRSFALVPAGELCPVHRESGKQDLSYFVLDDSHASFLLMSNQLQSGEHDVNPLREAIVRAKPPTTGRSATAVYDNRVELLGVDMPSSISRGDTFQVTLYFKVLKVVGGAWKVFAHFDTPGMRFQGDHDPIKGRCSTAFWQPGDYIIDRFTVEAGDFSYPKGNYQLKVGFFQGGHGNWKNMKVVKGNADDNDRVQVGTIQVK